MSEHENHEREQIETHTHEEGHEQEIELEHSSSGPLFGDLASPGIASFESDEDGEEDDNDTASQHSVEIALSSPGGSPRAGIAISPMDSPVQVPLTPTKRDSRADTIGSTEAASEVDDFSLYTSRKKRESSVTSLTPSEAYDMDNRGEIKTEPLPTYPPAPTRFDSEESVSSSSSYSKKARPESALYDALKGPLVLGIALVDFNHVVGPKIEFSRGDIFEDEEVTKIIPFLALPDGAHLTVEDFSYFHLVPSTPNPTTVFGISCTRQIAAASLTVKDVEVTRSTVQKAVVMLTSKPVFGLIRDRLGIITQALFDQKDFTETDILVDFYTTLELSLKTQLTESGLYNGTSLRELVHHFRQKTLVLLKALILQKRIMFYGHPVERLCTYQYSLISLIPGLLHTLEDSGSPPLNARAPTLTRPQELRTSNHKSLLNYLGLPLDIFGKDAFFQPYLPLQQLDMLKTTKSWMCGTSNSIVTSQKCVDLLVNIETLTFEFRDPNLERLAGLTAADRKWMDEVVRDVNDSWDEDDPTGQASLQFKGSDDYLRAKFEDYISAALSSVKWADFLAKGQGGGVVITGGPDDMNSIQDYNPLWIAEFKKTNAYEVWQRITDPTLFDIIEPRHPCNEKPSVVADIGLRLSEGIQEMKLDQQLAPTREAITKTFAAGSTNFWNAIEGVRGRWTAPPGTAAGAPASPATPTPTEPATAKPTSPGGDADSIRSFSPSSSRPASTNALSSIGAGIGSFFSSKATRFSLPRSPSVSSAAAGEKDQHRASKASVASAESPLPPVPASPAAVPPPPSKHEQDGQSVRGAASVHSSEEEGPAGMAL